MFLLFQVWDSKFSCPTLTEINGESRGFKGRDTATRHAVADFLNKIMGKNILPDGLIVQLREQLAV